MAALNKNPFQALSDTEVFVLGTNGNLWLEHGPFGNVPPSRQQVDGNVGWNDTSTFGDLTITPTSIVFSHNVDLDGLDVGSITGPISATITSNGSYNFSGNLNNSAWLPYNFSVIVVLKSKSGTAFVFSTNNNYQWDNNGNNSTIKDVWGDLQAECTYYYKAAANVDVKTLWNDLQTVIGYIKEAVQIAGSF